MIAHILICKYCEKSLSCLPFTRSTSPALSIAWSISSVPLPPMSLIALLTFCRTLLSTLGTPGIDILAMAATQSNAIVTGAKFFNLSGASLILMGTSACHSCHFRYPEQSRLYVHQSNEDTWSSCLPRTERICPKRNRKDFPSLICSSSSC